MHGPRCYTANQCLSNFYKYLTSSTEQYMNHSAQYPELVLASFFTHSMPNVCWETTKINQGSSCDLFVNSFNNIKKRTNGKSTGGGCSSGGGGFGGVPPLLPAPEINPPFFTSDDFWKKNCFGIKVDSLQTPMFWLKSAGVSRFIPWLPLWSFDLHGMTQQYPSGQKSVWGTVDCQTKL